MIYLYNNQSLSRRIRVDYCFLPFSNSPLCCGHLFNSRLLLLNSTIFRLLGSAARIVVLHFPLFLTISSINRSISKLLLMQYLSSPQSILHPTLFDFHLRNHLHCFLLTPSYCVPKSSQAHFPQFLHGAHRSVLLPYLLVH